MNQIGVLKEVHSLKCEKVLSDCHNPMKRTKYDKLCKIAQV